MNKNFSVISTVWDESDSLNAIFFPYYCVSNTAPRLDNCLRKWECYYARHRVFNFGNKFIKITIKIIMLYTYFKAIYWLIYSSSVLLELQRCDIWGELARLDGLAHLGEMIFIPHSYRQKQSSRGVRRRPLVVLLYGIFYLLSIKKFVRSLKKDSAVLSF